MVHDRLTVSLLLLALAGCSAPPSALSIEDLLAPDAAVTKIVGGMGFTEGPVWLPQAKKLVFSDIPGAKLMEWSPGGGLRTFRASPNPNGNVLDREGRLLTCRHGARDLVRTEPDGALTVLCDRYQGKRFNSPNDVAVKSDGTLWFTDPPWGLPNQREGRELAGHWVFRLDPATGEVTLLVESLSMPNGVAFSPDERFLYVSDTGGGSHPDPALRDAPASISAYRVNEDGTVDQEPVWRTLTLCDGMCVDKGGNLYTTAREGVKVLKPDGSVIGTIEVAEPPANCCFGGDGFSTLFITARTSVYAVQLTSVGAAVVADR